MPLSHVILGWLSGVTAGAGSAKKLNVPPVVVICPAWVLIWSMLPALPSTKSQKVSVHSPPSSAYWADWTLKG